MARYFKYKSADELVADAHSLGVNLRAQDNFEPLFEPIAVGGLLCSNRLVVQPMEGCDGTTNGCPDELTYRRYRRFGDGGAGLIWFEATAIVPEGRMNPRQLCLTAESKPLIADMLQQCRMAHREAMGPNAEIVAGLQLTHSGRYSFAKPLLAMRDPLLDPLTVDKSTGKPVDDSLKILTDDELRRLEDRYVEAAADAADMGFDFVDIKQCHRYLLNELLAARLRPGPYGGSFENRIRFVTNVVSRIRSELPGLIIASRLNVFDGVPFKGRDGDFVGEPRPFATPVESAFGTDPHDPAQPALDEPIRLVRRLAELGVSLLNISAGNPYANPHFVRPAEFPPTDGYHAPEHPLLGVGRQFELAARIQTAVPGVPVIGSAYSWLQDYAMHVAAANIADHRVAMIGMGRATLSHPDFARTLRETGALTRKKICRTFSFCTNLMRSKDHPLGQYATGCPPFDKEVYGPLWDAAKQD